MYAPLPNCRRLISKEQTIFVGVLLFTQHSPCLFIAQVAEFFMQDSPMREKSIVMIIFGNLYEIMSGL